MSAEAPAWGLKPGETYPATFIVGGRTFTFIGNATSPVSTTFRTAPEFFEQLRSDRSLQVAVNQRHFTVPLDGIEAATQRLALCVKEYAGRALLTNALQKAVPSTNAAPPPAVDEQPRIVYPAQAKQAGQEGLVLIDVTIDVYGRPTVITVEKTSGYAALDEAAIEAVRAAQFKPYIQNGKPQPVRVKVPIRFVLSDGDRPSGKK